MEKETLAVRWVEHKEESLPERRHNRGHADPTADAAIGHVLLEGTQKEKEEMSAHWCVAGRGGEAE